MLVIIFIFRVEVVLTWARIDKIDFFEESEFESDPELIVVPDHTNREVKPLSGLCCCYALWVAWICRMRGR